METPSKRTDDKKLILWVLGTLVGAIIVWGMSMYMLKLNMRRTMDLVMAERTRVKSIEAWVRRAKELHITYEDALFRAEEALGKPVVWDIRLPNKDPEMAYCNEDLNMPVRWSNPGKVAPFGGKGREGRTFTIVGVVRDVAAPKSVRKLKGESDSLKPYGITLEYLGYE